MQTASRVRTYIRMAAFPLGIGLTSVLVNGTLNRVMIVEQGLPASFVGLCFALPLLIAPVRVWLGYQSDTRPLWGLRRTPYIIAGTLLSVLGMLAATLLVLSLTLDNPLLVVLLGVAVLLAFLVYGLGRHLASNTFEALLADTFHGSQRPRAVTLFKVAMFVGIIGTALTLGILLDPFSPTRLTVITGAALLLTLLLTVLAVVGQERVSDQHQMTIAEARAVSFHTTITTVLWPDLHLRRFFEQAEESSDLLRYLEANGLLPGNQFFIPDASPAYGITLRRCNHDITLSAEIASILWGESMPIDAMTPEQ